MPSRTTGEAGTGLRPRKRADARTKQVLELREVVNRHFDVIDVRWDSETYAFFFHDEGTDYGDRFEALRVDLKKMDHTPKLSKDAPDYVIYVQKNPKMRFRGRVTNLVMFLLTIVSTVWAGAVLWAPFEGVTPTGFEVIGVLFKPDFLLFGFLYFALPLLLILGVHEFGHYFMARRHNVNASLPFFIPIPPFLGPLGTFGAFISLREPIPNKKALLEIGAAGPIAGFIVALPVTLIGLYLTGQDPCYCPGLGGMDIIIKEPLLFSLFTRIIEVPDGATLHPVAFAGWVGLLVTAFNLLPAGQLDGGHIVRALFGEQARFLSYFVIIALVVMAFWTRFITWGIFALLILIMGPKHPPPLNDLSPLKNMDKIIGVGCALIMVLCFHPAPLTVPETVNELHDMDMTVDSTFKCVYPGQNATFLVNISNTGNQNDNFELYFEAAWVNTSLDADYIVHEGMSFTALKPGGAVLFQGWNITLPEDNRTLIGHGDNKVFRVSVRSDPGQAAPGSGLALRVRAHSSESPGIVEESMHYVKLNTFGFQVVYSQPADGDQDLELAQYRLRADNPGPYPLHLNFTYRIIREDAPTRGWKVSLTDSSRTVGPESFDTLNAYIDPPAERFKGNTVVVRVYATDIDTGEVAITDISYTVARTVIAA